MDNLMVWITYLTAIRRPMTLSGAENNVDLFVLSARGALTIEVGTDSCSYLCYIYQLSFEGNNVDH